MTTPHFSRRQFSAGLLGTSLLTAFGGVAAAAQTVVSTSDPAIPTTGAAGEARLLYDQLFAKLLNATPELATSLGLDVGANAALRSQLSPSDPAHRFGFATDLAESRAAAAAIDADAMSAKERTYLETLCWFGDRAAELTTTPYGGFPDYPIPYVLSQLTGSYQSVPDFLDSTHPVANADDAAAYVSRLNAFAANINQEVDRARSDSAIGATPPDFVIAKALAQTRALIAQQQSGNGMAASLGRRAHEAGLDGEQWSARAASVVNGPIAAALQRQVEVLESLAPGASHVAGVSRLPGGDVFYAKALRYHTSTSLTPDEAHQKGLDEVASYTARLEPLLRQARLTRGSVGSRLTALARRPDQLYRNTDAGRAAILAFANQRTEAIRPMMAEIYPNPPAARLEIRRVPPAIEAGAPRGYAQSGSLDGTRPGAFYINLRDTHGWPRFSLPTLVYHEGLPGHIFQGAVLLAVGGTPNLHRTLGIAAYGEGWGLYAEQLADELGVYEHEPLNRIGYLQAALYRAVRVVVDTGMHARGWTRERAIQYMIDTAGLPPGSAVSEIERYVVWPAQATSYKIGHSEIVAIRAAAKAHMGAHFDLKQFHKVVLDQGSQPLAVLRANVERWSAGTH